MLCSEGSEFAILAAAALWLAAGTGRLVAWNQVALAIADQVGASHPLEHQSLGAVVEGGKDAVDLVEVATSHDHLLVDRIEVLLPAGHLGFDVELGSNQTPEAIVLMRLCDAIVPCIASAIAIWSIASYSITEEKAHEVRMQLEARRGT